jgi:hypothetical protein
MQAATGAISMPRTVANDSDHSHAEGRLFSSYDTPEHGTIWVITEDLRGEGGGPTTTVLFPEDY